jgi:hypothetical protein
MSSDANEFPDFRQEVFEGTTVDLYVQSALVQYPALAQNAKFRNHLLQQNVDQMVMTITTWCASGRIPTRSETETVRWPDGVWQMFKQQYMPHWFLSKFPVRFTEKEVEKTTYHYFVCPHIDTPAQGRDRLIHVKFMATGSPLAERIHTNAHV